jgi:two-component system sensor histidine kinase VanS
VNGRGSGERTARRRGRLRRPRLRLGTVRARFTLAYAGLLGGTGVALVVLFYAYLDVANLVQVGIRPTEADGERGVPPEPWPGEETASAVSRTVANAGLIALVLVVVLIAMWIGWLIAGRLLRPLDAINDTAVRVGHGDLSRRVELTGPDDEFANLARVLNAMLDRIRQSVEAHRRFAANASHELRTPLATNKAMLSVALDDPADADLVRLASRLQQVNEHSIETVEALLDLADIGQAPLELEAVDLARIAAGQVEDLLGEAEARSVAVTTDLRPAPAYGSPVLLTRLVANLLQNATRHNHDGGEVWVRTGERDGAAWVEVANTGAVVPPEVAPTLVDPFVRRQGRTEGRSGGRADGPEHAGRGLGLAIVDSIATAHRARLDVVPRDGGGLRVSVLLPR